MTATQPVLELTDLRVEWGEGRGRTSALAGVELRIQPGETVAVVGESGAGKSTLAAATIGLLPSGATMRGRIVFDGEDVTRAGRRRRAALRGREIGYVPQDPMASLDPLWTIGFQVGEVVRATGLASGRREVRERTVELLRRSGFAEPAELLRRHPHQLSGGMRQRVLIGMALAARPKLVVADEPTSALDATAQDGVLDRLAVLAREAGTSVLLITHDLRVAAERADRVYVMRNGRVVEEGAARTVLTEPRRPYTRALVAAVRRPAAARLSATGAEPPPPSAPAPPSVPALIDVTGLTKVYPGGVGRPPVVAVEDLSFSVAAGATTALVGPSGSGKSTVARVVLGLEAPTAGRVRVFGEEPAGFGRRRTRALRRRIQPVFQDSSGSLDPRLSVQAAIAEPLSVHRVGPRRERRRRVAELLDLVALPSALAHRRPDELSGGQRQRVAIARALALDPEIVVLDEPVTALDALVQAQVLELLARLQEERGLGFLLITHDPGVVDALRGVVVDLGDPRRRALPLG